MSAAGRCNERGIAALRGLRRARRRAEMRYAPTTAECADDVAEIAEDRPDRRVVLLRHGDRLSLAQRCTYAVQETAFGFLDIDHGGLRRGQNERVAAARGRDKPTMR